MCFSAEADLVAGLVVGVIGVDALVHVRHPSERPIAALPVILAGHQLIEALVWLGLEGRVSSEVWRPAMWLYLVIAFGVVPVLIPFAVRALDRDRRHGDDRVFVAIGVVVAALLVYPLLRGPVEARIVNHHIDYTVDLWHGGWLVAFYVLATCGSMLRSRDPSIRMFGALNFAAVCVLVWLENSAFISLWCLWAAFTSLAIAVHLRRAESPPRHAVAAR